MAPLLQTVHQGLCGSEGVNHDLQGMWKGELLVRYRRQVQLREGLLLREAEGLDERWRDGTGGAAAEVSLRSRAPDEVYSTEKPWRVTGSGTQSGAGKVNDPIRSLHVVALVAG